MSLSPLVFVRSVPLNRAIYHRGFRGRDAEVETPVPESPGSAEALPPEVTTRRGLRILLAEDNRVNQAVASRILAKLGHILVIANNGLEAIEQLRQQAFDLVLMDVQMPEMDGILATKVIREPGKINP